MSDANTTTTATTGAGGILKLNPAGTGALTALAQITNISPTFATGSVDITPIGAAGISQHVAGKQELSLSANLNWIPATYAGATKDLLNEWQANTFSDWEITFTEDATPTTWGFQGFLTGLNLNIPDGEAMTGDITIQVKRGITDHPAGGVAGEYLHWSNGTKGSGAANAAMTGTGFVLRMADWSGAAFTAATDITDVSGVRLSLAKSVVFADSQGSFSREPLPGRRSGTLSFDANFVPNGVATYAAFGPEAGAEVNPSVYEAWLNRWVTDWEMLFSNEIPTPGVNYQLWQYAGFVTGMSLEESDEAPVAGTVDVQLTGDITATTEAV